MLNISENKIDSYIQTNKMRSFSWLEERKAGRLPLYIFISLLGVAFAAMFLPWTQNVQAKGYVTTVQPGQRPQAIQSVIGGQLNQWYVQEGDFVSAGDTIVYITEVKPEYFDPKLVQRTDEQVQAKARSVESYSEKVRSLEQQYNALQEARELKLEQTRNKIQQTRLKIISDSTDLIAFRANLQIAERQFERTKELYDKGLKSLTEFETKNLKLQEAQAKVISQENKLLTQRNELINLKVELSAINSDYADKLAKSQSDKFSALSGQLEAEATTSKLRNQLSNYSKRREFYSVVAPQSGYIAKAVSKGVGEIIKEGTDIVTIMPSNYQLAVEIYVKPIDVPLLDIGHEVRIQFDGWPAVVFSGWPNTSFGTFEGNIIAIEQFISKNGKYRVLVAPTENDKTWPNLLRVGSGARAFILLQDVPLWYELWRQLNGFPPNFYNPNATQTEEVKLKAPLRDVK